MNKVIDCSDSALFAGHQHGLWWYVDSLEDGGTFHRCPGDNLTLFWQLETQRGGDQVCVALGRLKILASIQVYIVHFIYNVNLS
jgi:hypothetical protein